MKRMSLLVLVVLLAGCQQKYYRVTDNESDKIFYAQAWHGGPTPRKYGGTRFTDVTTGEWVYLSSYRVAEVSPAEVPGTQPAKR